MEDRGRSAFCSERDLLLFPISARMIYSNETRVKFVNWPQLTKHRVSRPPLDAFDRLSAAIQDRFYRFFRNRRSEAVVHHRMYLSEYRNVIPANRHEKYARTRPFNRESYRCWKRAEPRMQTASIFVIIVATSIRRRKLRNRFAHVRADVCSSISKLSFHPCAHALSPRRTII